MWFRGNLYFELAKSPEKEKKLSMFILNYREINYMIIFQVFDFSRPNQPTHDKQKIELIQIWGKLNFILRFFFLKPLELVIFLLKKELNFFAQIYKIFFI